MVYILYLCESPDFTAFKNYPLKVVLDIIASKESRIVLVT